MTDEIPTVACVVLNWNTYDDTADCLGSLFGLSYDNLNIIVVDNGSTDGSADRLADAFPSATVIRNETNLGFGAGMNAGISEAIRHDADYVTIVNSDIVVDDSDLISSLRSTIESADDIGIVSPRIIEYPETNSLWFEQGYVDERNGNASHLHSHRRVPNLRMHPVVDESPLSQRPTLLSNDYVPLCFAFIEAEIFEEVGLLPEQYFMYYEDIEFAKQVRERGYRIVTDASSAVYHRVSGSSDGDQSPLAEYYTARNRLIFVRERTEYGPMGVFVYVWWVLVKLVYTAVTRRFSSFKALSLGAYDGILGRTGKGRYP
ncbi:glycosyltransferase family 2 protein [Halosimplex rubrum]|uniref:Glycosyltransferase family 2 protein n=1 Tax=Halosimplex rubrum TaxID=869889 RepID=A0A7D5SZ67_9EURY|nr:glycosyltransferase family 2 protein [Halosimplex rubrum]QLH76868.1 glycosyltransferase family 2 protein [Halosimplex rubrum]